jgi:hypothetical protein
MVTVVAVILPLVSGALAALGAFWVAYRVGYPLMDRVVHGGA